MKRSSLLLVAVLTSAFVNAQSVGLETSTPNASTVLHVDVVPVFIEAIKELQQQVKQLKDKLEKQEK